MHKYSWHSILNIITVPGRWAYCSIPYAPARKGSVLKTDFQKLYFQDITSCFGVLCVILWTFCVTFYALTDIPSEKFSYAGAWLRGWVAAGRQHCQWVHVSPWINTILVSSLFCFTKCNTCALYFSFLLMWVDVCCSWAAFSCNLSLKPETFSHYYCKQIKITMQRNLQHYVYKIPEKSHLIQSTDSLPKNFLW